MALFFMDYARRLRLKAFDHVRVVIRIEGTDWNCSQHIPMLLPAEDVRGAITALRQRIELLEQQLAAADRS